jgi:large subunit ribosomal protein L17
MLRNLTANLITHERIQTTDAKAKELRRVAERLITKAVRLGDVAYEKGAEGDRARVARRLHVARQIGAYIPRFGVVVNEEGISERIDLVEKVLLDLAKRFQGRPGGYTRIIKIGPRRGDNAPMSFIEFVGNEEAEETTEAKAEETTEAKAEETTEAKAEETEEKKTE